MVWLTIVQYSATIQKLNGTTSGCPLQQMVANFTSDCEPQAIARSQVRRQLGYNEGGSLTIF